jgi:type IV secretion system protein VirB11
MHPARRRRPKAARSRSASRSSTTSDWRSIGERGAFRADPDRGRRLVLSAVEEELTAMMHAGVDAMEFLRTAVRSRVFDRRVRWHVDGQDHLSQRPPEGRAGGRAHRDHRGHPRIEANYPGTRWRCLRREGARGRAKVTAQELLEASLRMRPDRVMLGELPRHRSVLPSSRRSIPGHPGSLTTVHANSARSAYERLALMVMQSGNCAAETGHHRLSEGRHPRGRAACTPAGRTPGRFGDRLHEGR